MARSDSKNSRTRGNIDMLSNLPDSILHHIMSFIPAQQAVQLCVLSKRWKTLWTTLHVLNCGFNELWNNQLCAYTVPYWMMEKLAEFVSTVLLLREATSQLHTFTLDCGLVYVRQDDDLLRTSIKPWIRYAIKHNLRVLTINICINQRIILPSEVLTCPSLEHVALSFRGRIDTPKIINLPSLKRLHLKKQELDQDFMSKLLCGCPVLEDLHVEGGLIEFSNIISHSLKHLKLMTDYHHGSTELINCPNLLSFQFVLCSYCQKKEITLNMPSLCEACIEFSICYHDNIDVTQSNILRGLFNVHHLELKGNFPQDCLRDEIANCRTFSKLTCLSVGNCCLNCRFDVLSSLLEHCPNLKKLSLLQCGYLCEEQCMSKQIKVARFKCEQLETVEVKFYMKDRTFHSVVKCLQEAVAELPNCSIVMTSIAYP